ncbi:MAG TPA: CpsB/CapC family capsule biosynthesis tyrosine phosphatase [Gaiellaceae bacterium]|nr:CpsB/CapC family capsule biosynthesis tyrosine phosphatase [Gaiellaceae bacterium]
MIDLHSHILPGVDDGPTTIEESLEIARRAAADGVRIIAATPHVRDDYPTSAETMERLVAEVRKAVLEAEIPVDVRPGGEIAIDWLDRLSEDDIGRFGLGGSPRYLLVEFPYSGWPLSLHEWIFQLVTREITPVIAHPERNADVQRDPSELRPLVDAGALVQVTAASLDGRIGRSAKTAAFELIDRGLAHLLASDAHTPDVREGGLAGAVEAVGDPELARWLTVEVPMAVITDAPVPRRPETKKRRFRRR